MSESGVTPRGGATVPKPSGKAVSPKPAAEGVPPDAADAWNRTVAELSEKWRATGKMLEGTYAHHAEGQTLFVRFLHATQFARLQTNPAGQSKITDAFRSIIGPDWNLRFELDEPKAEEGPNPVAEGEELAELVESVFDARPE